MFLLQISVKHRMDERLNMTNGAYGITRTAINILCAGGTPPRILRHLLQLPRQFVRQIEGLGSRLDCKHRRLRVTHPAGRESFIKLHIGSVNQREKLLESI